MSLIAGVCLLLVSAHGLGWLAERLGQPALLGQMLAGILVGPAITGWLSPGPGLAAAADISVLFVVITAGLEMRMQDVLYTLRSRGAVGLLLGFIIPAACAALFTYALGLAFVPATVTVLCVSVTALPVALRILGSFGLLNTRVARVAISSSLLADVIVLLVLGVLIALSRPATSTSSLWSTSGLALIKLVVLLAVVAVAHIVCGKLSARQRAVAGSAIQGGADSVLILALLFMVGLGVVSELLGFHYAIGAFLGALLVTGELITQPRFQSLSHTFEMMAVAVFGPLFLAYQGVQFDLGVLKDSMLVPGLAAVAITSKMSGGFAAARLAGLPRYEAYGVAIIMNARGVMEMVVASIAYRAGLISQELFSALLIVGIVTTMITPSLLKLWLKDESQVKAMINAGASRA